MQQTVLLEMQVELLAQRVAGIENMLVGSLFGFLLTATFTALAALYTVRAEKKESFPNLPAKHALVGVAVLYLFLGGYYYFMLAQYYAAAGTLVKIARANRLQIDALWLTMRWPSFGVMSQRWSGVAMLLNAPLLPALFSTAALLAFWFLVHEEKGNRVVARRVLVATIGVQWVQCLLMMWVPFGTFCTAVAP